MRQDERESLSHILQSIDEQEIFLEFVAKSNDIKEAWQIADIFESKKNEFVQGLKKYESFVEKKEKELEAVQKDIKEANDTLKEVNKELETIKSGLVDMQTKAKFYKNKINQGKTIRESILEMQLEGVPDDKEMQDLLNITPLIREFQPLGIVDVHVKDGKVARARVAQKIYSENLYENYKKSSIRLIKLKEKIRELELTNSKLEIELRDYEYENTEKLGLLKNINIPLMLESSPLMLEDKQTQNQQNVKQEIDNNTKSIKDLVSNIQDTFKEVQGDEEKEEQ